MELSSPKLKKFLISFLKLIILFQEEIFKVSKIKISYNSASETF